MCIFSLFRDDELGHIAIEVFAELDDGGDYSKHNCCFFVRTEYGLLMNFCDHLDQLKNGSVGCEIRLNCFKYPISVATICDVNIA